MKYFKLFARCLFLCTFAVSLLLPSIGFTEDEEEWPRNVFYLPARIIDSYFPWGEAYLIPHDPAYSANIKRAEEFELKNDYRQASRYYFLAYKKAQNTPKAPYILFKQSSILEDIYQSINSLKEILEAYPDFPLIDAVRFELAKQYYILKNYENASQLLKEIENNEKAGPPIFLPYVYTFLGVINYRQKNFEKAAGYYILSNEILAAGDTTGDRISIINNYFELSAALTESGDYENAEDLLKRILGSVSSGALKQEALLKLGFLYSKKSDVDGALSAFKSVVQENPGSLFALEAGRGIQDLGVRDEENGWLPIEGVFDNTILDGTYKAGTGEKTEGQDVRGGEEIGDVRAGTRKGYAVQLGSFSNQKNAERLVLVLTEKGFDAYSISASIESKPVFRVRVGTVPTRDDAEELKNNLQDLGFGGFIVEEK